MPVEILVLSGSRQGELLRFDKDRIQIGAGPGDDVCFDAGRDRGAADKRAVLSATGDGWWLTVDGADRWLVNQTPTVSRRPARVRSGDVIRLSEAGPDFRFSVVSSRLSLPVEVPAATGTADVAQPPRPTAASQWPVAAVAAVVLAAACVIFGLLWRGLPSQPAVAPDPGSGLAAARTAADPGVADDCDAAPPVATQAAATHSAGEGESELQNSNARRAVGDREQGPPLAPDRPPTADVTETESAADPQVIAAAIVWLGGEAEGFKIPLCTGFAISPTMVVSTAREVSQLAAFRDGGHQVFVFQSTPAPTFLNATSIVLHPRYDPNDPGSAASRLYNVGVVTVEQALPYFLGLATSAEITSSLADLKLAVTGYSIPDGDEARAYDRLAPPPLVTRDAVIRATRPLPGGDDLPLLVLEVETVAGMDGAPLLCEDGRALGLLVRAGQHTYGLLSDRFEAFWP